MALTNQTGTVLIIGKLPPPIGGVTVHVQRLLDHLACEKEVKSDFLNLSSEAKSVLFKILKYNVIHLNTSNVLLRFLVSLYCRVFYRKLLVTFHGNLGRFGKLKNILDILSVRFCTIPIVINLQSFAIATKVNRRTMLIPAFIPPLFEQELDGSISDKIQSIKSKYRFVCCSNAYNFTRDKNGEEIYGILQLIRVFTRLPEFFLIVSDPSGAYYQYLIENKILIPENVFIISFEHDFYKILKSSDLFIRNTTTDGDSLSVKEALFLGKNVIASDVVDRPNGCNLYSRGEDDQLLYVIANYKPYDVHDCTSLSGYPDLISLYKTILI